MRNPKYSKLLLLAFLLLLLSACNDFEEINTNPNIATEIRSELLLDPLITQIVQDLFENGYEKGAGLARHIARTNFNEVEQYAFEDEQENWNKSYLRLNNINEFLKLAREESLPSSEALGMILKAVIGAQMTDLWRDVAFYDAASNDGDFTPRYDSQEDIYLGDGGIIDLLNSAQQMLTTNTDVLPSDILYQGNREKWTKLCNSLLLRYLMRISNRADEITAFDVPALISEIVSSRPLILSNRDNALMPFLSVSPYQCPIYEERQGSFQYQRLSIEMDSILNGYNDPRLSVWMAPTAASVGSEKPEYIGVPVGLTATTLEEIGYDGAEVSQLGDYYRAFPDRSSAIMMNCSELHFLIAEAIVKGYAEGDAEAYYLDGISTSMSYYEVEASDDYLTQVGVAYSEETALEQIMLQKWLSMFLVGFESWFDYLRTDLPNWLPLMDNRNATDPGGVPSRFKYSVDEQALNKESYDQAVQALGGVDDINVPHWWE